ncbi:hypothetical protein [uncultured Sphingomonas sp.]|uniref:hypothetical protein n=1 Tax=uncultured Sphingomonas sp. TaxID=158754 RepID=UPI0035C9CF58
MSDPAFVAGLLVAALYFSGWTYYDAYFLRLGLNPAGFGFANVGVGIKGASAMLTTLAALLGAMLPLLVAILLLVLAVLMLRHFGVGRWRKGQALEPDQLSPVVFPASSIALAIGVVLVAGPYAGRIKAQADLALVGRGDGWDYHLQNDVVRGLPIGQNDTRIWLLTRADIRPIKADDIKLQNGQLFERVKVAR